VKPIPCCQIELYGVVIRKIGKT